MNRSRILWQGFVAGLIGYATVAVVFAAVNALSGLSPFYTAALLGSALFYGARTLSDVVLAPGPVLAYNGFHLVVFLVLGVFMAWLTELAQRGPHLWYLGMLAYVLVAFHAFAFVFSLPELLREALLGWGALGCGILASLAMGAFLFGVHPRLQAEMKDFSAQDADLADEPR
jgi:hypothetical protein